MAYNAKADIHQHYWYESSTSGKRYLCTSAGWVQDKETEEWTPQNIQLLEYLSRTPRHVPFENMKKMLEEGTLVVCREPV